MINVEEITKMTNPITVSMPVCEIRSTQFKHQAVTYTLGSVSTQTGKLIYTPFALQQYQKIPLWGTLSIGRSVPEKIIAEPNKIIVPSTQYPAISQNHGQIEVTSVGITYKHLSGSGASTYILHDNGNLDKITQPSTVNGLIPTLNWDETRTQNVSLVLLLNGYKIENDKSIFDAFPEGNNGLAIKIHIDGPNPTPENSQLEKVLQGTIIPNHTKITEDCKIADKRANAILNDVYLNRIIYQNNYLNPTEGAWPHFDVCPIQINPSGSFDTYAFARYASGHYTQLYFLLKSILEDNPQTEERLNQFNVPDYVRLVTRRKQ